MKNKFNVCPMCASEHFIKVGTTGIICKNCNYIGRIDPTPLNYPVYTGEEKLIRVGFNPKNKRSN